MQNVEEFRNVFVVIENDLMGSYGGPWLPIGRHGAALACGIAALWHDIFLKQS